VPDGVWGRARAREWNRAGESSADECDGGNGDPRDISREMEVASINLMSEATSSPRNAIRSVELRSVVNVQYVSVNSRHSPQESDREENPGSAPSKASRRARVVSLCSPLTIRYIPPPHPPLPLPLLRPQPILERHQRRPSGPLHSQEIILLESV